MAIKVTRANAAPSGLFVQYSLWINTLKLNRHQRHEPENSEIMCFALHNVKWIKFLSKYSKKIVEC